MKKILIVDDSPSIITLVRISLSSIDNVELFEASSGEHALEIINNNNDISLLITDLMMPGMSGWDLIKKVRGNISLKNINVLILTSEYTVLSSSKYYESGANDILLKPFRSERILQKVNELL